MSWQATAWAKKVKGIYNPTAKLVLMVLSDYYDDEKGYAWPNQTTLADDCEVSVRTIRNSMNHLVSIGLVVVLQKGNQNMPSRYAMMLDVAYSNIYEPEHEDVPEHLAGAPGEGGPASIPKRQHKVAAPATGVGTSTQKETVPPVSDEPGDDEMDSWPAWYVKLREIPEFCKRGTTVSTATAWLDLKDIPDDLAEAKAYALVGAWGPSRWKNSYAVWQNWCWSDLEKWVKDHPPGEKAVTISEFLFKNKHRR